MLIPGAQTFIAMITAFGAVPAGFVASAVVGGAADMATSAIMSSEPRRVPPRASPDAAAIAAVVGAMAVVVAVVVVPHAIFFWMLRRTRKLGTDDTSLGLTSSVWRGVLWGGYAVGFVSGVWAMWF